ncbi:MAG: DNA translocase FtsK [Butyrivibrio sp.]|nr:DNA translocase FtsK [Butyrivibrio sp.]
MASGKRNYNRKKKTGSTGKSGNRQTRRENEQLDYALKSEILIIVLLALSIFLFLCNFGVCGSFGDIMSGIMFGIFGVMAYLAPLLIFLMVVFHISNNGSAAAVRKIVAGCVLALLFGMLAEIISGRVQMYEGYDPVQIYMDASNAGNGGGVIAGSLCYLCFHTLSMAGTVILILVFGTISIVVLTEKSVIEGIRSGSHRVMERAGEDAAEYRQQMEERRTRNEERRQQEAEQKRLLLEQKEDEKILRMNKKVSGITASIDLKKEEDEEEKDTEKQPDQKQPKAPAASHNIFIPDEDEIRDDIHEITIHSQMGTDVEPDGQHVIHTGPVIHTYVKEEEQNENGLPAALPEVTGMPEVHEAANVLPEETEVFPLEELTEQEEEAEENQEDIPQQRPGARLQVQVAADALPDIPIHRENAEVNDGYTVHTQDHISPAKKAQQIDSHASAPMKVPEPGMPQGGRTMAAESDAGAGSGIQQEILQKQAQPVREYVFPPLSLLKKGVKNKNTDSEKQLKETAMKLEKTLKTFGVNVTVTDISQGPAVTRYELQPEVGVKVSRIVNLSDDIKLNLAATDIRIEAPIPGKPAVGIEVPNKENSMVALRDLFESEEYQHFSSRLAFAVGKDIAGKTVVTDIAKMPHLLIAGATGSGKSVCINTMILSLIYKSKPEEVRLIMIDPKVVELSVYNGIPHLLIPVVTDPKKAAAALNWAVQEMTTRYKKFADAEVRDLKGYNEYVQAHQGEDESLVRMPQIVIIVDELADLMMVSANEVEEAICRLAQLARAAGIHLIIATQRPSVDVITGLIKANMPSRIAFAVSSGTDSRTILDMNGAEKLLGKGDMLFYPQNYSKPVRIQGAFVSDQEIQGITDFLKKQTVETSYSSDIQEEIQNLQTAGGGNASDAEGSDLDEYFADAGRFIIEKDKASIGMLQRVFKIGFNRAARIMDQLCDAGVVGEEEGTKPRKVLMSKEEFEQMEEDYENRH